jgi:hypothetical protein
LQTYGNSEFGDHIKSDEINMLSGDNHMQAVQELQVSICVNKEGVQENINSETDDQKITEEDTMNQEKTGLLPKRIRHQPLKRNKNFYGKSPERNCLFSKQRKI